MLRILNIPVERAQRRIVSLLERGVGDTVNVLVFILSKEVWHCQHIGSVDVKAMCSSCNLVKHLTKLDDPRKPLTSGAP